MEKPTILIYFKEDTDFEESKFQIECIQQALPDITIVPIFLRFVNKIEIMRSDSHNDIFH